MKTKFQNKMPANSESRCGMKTAVAGCNFSASATIKEIGRIVFKISLITKTIEKQPAKFSWAAKSLLKDLRTLKGILNGIEWAARAAKSK